MPTKKKPRPGLLQPGDIFETSLDCGSLSLYPAVEEGAPELSALDARWLKSVTDFAGRGKYLPVTFLEDNGCSARFRLGDADPQEDAEWIGQVVWKLDLTHGLLGCNELVIAVPPAEYRVEVRLYVPSTSALELMALAEKRQEEVWDYWQRTRPGELIPGWMLEMVTSEDEDVVPSSLLPSGAVRTDALAGFRVKVNGRWRELPQSSPLDYVDLLVRLTPLTGLLTMPNFASPGRYNKPVSTGKSREDRSNPWSFLWEARKPALCPTGLVKGTPIPTPRRKPKR